MPAFILSHSQLRQRILFGLLFVLGVVYLVFEYDHVGDFLVYYQASQNLFLSKNIYAEGYGEMHVLPYYGSPSLAFLLGPFTLLPFPIAAMAWKICSLFFLYRTWLLIESYFDIQALSPREYIWFILISFFSVSFVLYRNFTLNQFTVFLLYVILEGLHLVVDKKKDFLGANLIGLGIVCKMLPLVTIPYFVYRGYRKAALFTILCTLFWVFFPLVFLGWENGSLLLQEWLHTINPNQERHVFDVTTNDIHGLPAFIPILFIEDLGFDQYTLTLRRHIVNLDPQVVKIILHIVRGFFIAFALYFLRSHIFQKETRPQWQLWELGYILTITPLIFPQQRLYAFYFLFPAIAYLTYHIIKYNRERLESSGPVPFLFYVYATSILIFNLELILGHFREYYWHFKTVTYSVFVFLYVYAATPPSSISSPKII